MAKLYNVKTIIPAVAERIEYNGVEYVRTEEDAKVGDIIRIADDEDSSFLTDGGYYEVTDVDSADDAQIVDDDGDEYDTANLDEQFAVFKRTESGTQSPASAPAVPTQLPDAYLVHDGKVYRKEMRKAKVGEKVIVIANTTYHDLSIGDIVDITESRNSGLKRVRTAREGAWMETDCYNVLVPVDSVMVGGAEYGSATTFTLAQRKANVGERVLVVNGSPVANAYKDGDVLTVKRTWDAGIDVEETKYDLWNREYLVLVPMATVAPTPPTTKSDEAKYRTVSRKARVGERIRIVNAKWTGGNYDNGDEFVIERIDRDGDTWFTGRKGKAFFAGDSEYVVLEPVAAESAPVAKPGDEYSVGDYVKVIANRHANNYDIGSVVKITLKDEESRGFRFKAERTDGTTGNWLRPSEIERASEADFNAQIKPKVGDYFRVVHHGGGHNYAIGDIVEVTRVDSSELFYAKVIATGRNGNCLHVEQCVRATDAEVAEALTRSAEAQRKAACETLKPGDTVRLTIAEGKSPQHGWGSVKNGDIGTVRSIINGNLVKVDFPKQPYWSAKPSELVRITQEEAETARKSAEETAQWAKIGRKVGELKAGDIVRFTKNTGAIEYKSGSVAEICNVRGSDFRFGVDRDYIGDASWCEIVVPVEQRLDRQ